MKFHISDVLSITTDRLVSLDHMEGVYRICDGMTGVSNFTHQLPRVAEQIKPVILEQHPGLREVVVPTDAIFYGDDRDAILARLKSWFEMSIYPRFGEELEITPLAEYVGQDPIQELVDKVGPDRVIPIILEGKVGM